MTIPTELLVVAAVWVLLGLAAWAHHTFVRGWTPQAHIVQLCFDADWYRQAIAGKVVLSPWYWRTFTLGAVVGYIVLAPLATYREIRAGLAGKHAPPEWRAEGLDIVAYTSPEAVALRAAAALMAQDEPAPSA